MTLWVFGYGSLLWNPGFTPVRREIARLPGWHRSFCMWSMHYRGTPEAPGLVLALDRAEDGACMGQALAVAPGEEEAVLEYLRARELVSYAYHEKRLPLELASGERVEGLTYVIDRDHAQYAGGLSAAEQAAVIARASGGKGPNRDYLTQTLAHLTELGIEDAEMSDLAARVAAG